MRLEIGLIVVESDGGSRGRSNTEALHDRLGTVVPGPDGDSLLVENRTHVVWVDSVEYEREHGRLVGRRSDDPHTRDRF